MGNSQLHLRRAPPAFFAALLVLAAPVNAAELQARTAQNYERYVALTQAQFGVELTQGNPYLWVERLPEQRRAAAETQLRNGEVVIEHLETLDNGKPIPLPGAMIHHWIATIFVPGATLAQTLTFMQDYDHNVNYFQPEIVSSKILKHEGDDYFVRQRFYKKKIITTVMETDQQVHYHVVDSTHAWSRSRVTRIQQVDNWARPDERLEPEGHDKGFVWKLNAFWRFEEKNGGTYLECTSISLSRDLPVGLGWVVGSLVSNLSKETLAFTLTTSRTEIAKQTPASN
jgi:hypothetical protein